jgi:(p)ppGpp synthase/HD superfamily hydrolase
MRFLSPTIKQALYFSAETHDGQYRKGGKVPYIVHPVLVAMGVSQYTTDDDVVAAALLHDVLEDCEQISLMDLKEKFGSRITSLVEEVSFLERGSSKLVWKEKKLLYLQKIENCSKEALMIIGADKMTNMKAYFEMLEKNPAKIKELFKASPEEYLWYYKSVGEILKSSMSGSPIVEDYHTLIRTIEK